jgi:hypothetical protein
MIFHTLIFPPQIYNVHLLIIQTTPLHGGRLLAAKEASSFPQPTGVWLPGGDERTIFIHVEGKEENVDGVMAKQHGSSSGHGPFPSNRQV